MLLLSTGKTWVGLGIVFQGQVRFNINMEGGGDMCAVHILASNENCAVQFRPPPTINADLRLAALGEWRRNVDWPWTQDAFLWMTSFRTWSLPSLRAPRTEPKKLK